MGFVRLRGKVFLCMFGLIVAAHAGVSAREPGTLMVENSGFERGVSEHFKPMKCRVGAAVQDPYEGLISARVYFDQPRGHLPRGWAQGGLQMADAQPLGADTSGRLMCDFGVRLCGDRAVVAPRIVFRNALGMSVRSDEKPQRFELSAAGRWQRIRCTFAVPLSARTYCLYIQGNGPQGEAFEIDAIRLYASGVEPAPANSAVPFDSRLLLFAPLQSPVAITLDGESADPGWNQLAWSGDFVHFDGTPARCRTFFKVVRGQAGFYFVVRAAVADKKQQSDGDTVRIALSKGVGSEPFAECTIGAAGLQSSVPQHRNGSGWQVRARQHAAGYTVEAFLPCSPDDAAMSQPVLGLNIFRTPGDQGAASSWVGAGPEQYAGFGQLICGPGRGQPLTTPSVVADPLQGKITITVDGSGPGELSGWITYFHRTGFEDGEYRSKKIALPGNGGHLSLPFWRDLSGGAHLLTIVRRESEGITAARTVRFRTDERPETQLSYEHPVLIPAAKQVQWLERPFALQELERIVYVSTPLGQERETAQMLQAQLAKAGISISLVAVDTVPAELKRTLLLGTLEHAAVRKLAVRYAERELAELEQAPDFGQGFVLCLGEHGSGLLAGQAGAGAYYAMRTFLQLVRFDPDMVPQAKIIDWPDHPHRSVVDLHVMQYLRVMPWEMAERYLFDIVASGRFNELTILGSRGALCFEQGENKRIYGAGGSRLCFPKKDLQRFIDFARKNFITVIPGLNSHSKSSWLFRAYPQLREFPGTHVKRHRGLACTRHPDFYKVLFPIMEEMYATFGRQPVFFIGHDEIGFMSDEEDINSCPRCGSLPKWQLVLDDIRKQAQFLKSLGVREVRMWDDMLLEGWHGGEPLNIARIRTMLPRDLIVPVHWAAEPPRKYSPEPLFSAGYEHVIWRLTQEVTPFNLPRDISRYQAVGMGMHWIVPAWISWSLLPDNWSFQQVLRCGDLLWNAATRRNWKTPEEFAFRFGTAVMRQTSARPVGSGVNYTPLAVPGRKTVERLWGRPAAFDPAPLREQVAGSRYRSLVHDGRALQVGPRCSAGIAVDGTCRTIALLHAAHMNDRDLDIYKKKLHKRRFLDRGTLREGWPLGSYVLEYADGSRAAVQIGLGYNIFWGRHADYLNSLTLYDAAEVWAVPSEEQPFAAAVYVLVNPYPLKRVARLRVENTSSHATLVLFSAAVER